MTGLSAGSISGKVVMGLYMLRLSWNLKNVKLELINAVLAKFLCTENSTTSAEGRK